MAEFAWRIVFDDHQEMVIYADDLYDVLSFVQSNQTPLFGHDGVAHLNIQINKLTENEISEHYALGLVDEVQEYDNGDNPFGEGFWLPQPGETIPDEVRTETVDEPEQTEYNFTATAGQGISVDPKITSIPFDALLKYVFPDGQNP